MIRKETDPHIWRQLQIEKLKQEGAPIHRLPKYEERQNEKSSTGSLKVEKRNDPAWFKFFKWSGNIFLFTAAAAVALSTDWSVQVWPFVCYTIGCFIWGGAAVLMGDRPLLAQMTFFAAVDIYAIYIRL